MAQEVAASMTGPRGWIVYAWLDAALHPKFATFQRWFPLMKTRWRRISLTMSVFLIVVTMLMYLANHAFPSPRDLQSLSFSAYVAYLFSSAGLTRFFFDTTVSLVLLCTMPAVVTLISPRSLGPYHIRFKRVFRPWMQVQPAICLLLLLGAIAQFALGFFQSTSWILELVAVMLTAGPALQSWSLTCAALSAGGSRDIYLTGLVAAVPGILIWLLPFLLGHPVA